MPVNIRIANLFMFTSKHLKMKEKEKMRKISKYDKNTSNNF